MERDAAKANISCASPLGKILSVSLYLSICLCLSHLCLSVCLSPLIQSMSVSLCVCVCLSVSVCHSLISFYLCLSVPLSLSERLFLLPLSGLSSHVRTEREAAKEKITCSSPQGNISLSLHVPPSVFLFLDVHLSLSLAVSVSSLSLFLSVSPNF